jgi:hypothetical protein
VSIDFQSKGSHAGSEDRLVVSYNNSYPGFYVARTLPLFAIFAILAFLYLDDEMRRLIFSRFTSREKAFSWFEFGFLLALMFAPLLDLALTLRRVRRGAMALVVSPEGIMGSVLHKHRLLPWGEIEDVGMQRKFIVVQRKPLSLLQKVFAGRGLGNISVPVAQLDHEFHEILAAIHRYSPVQLGREPVH